MGLRQLFLFSVVVVVLGSGGAVAGACSSFSGEDPPGDGAVASDAPSSPEGAVAAHACDPGMVATDGEHCGRCDHSCLGGTCSGGVCQPTTLTTMGAEAIVDVRLEPTRVLWTTTSGTPWASDGNVFACAKTGCGPNGTPFLQQDTPIGSLFTDGVGAQHSYVSFVFANAGIRKIDQTLGPTALPEQKTAVHLTTSGSFVYFLDRYADGGAGGAAHKWDTSGALVTQVATRSGNIRDFAFANDLVFLADPVAISSSTVVAPMQQTFWSDETASIQSLVTDGQNILWVSSNQGIVYSCGAIGVCNGAQSVVQIAPPDKPAAVVVDHGTILVTTVGGDIFACDAAAGCGLSPLPIAHIETGLFDKSGSDAEYLYGHNVAADETAIYFTEKDGAGGHRLMRLAK